MLSRLLYHVQLPPPLPNTGSLARDCLAGERTFLAWLRTGLAFIALGVALEKVEAFAALSPTLLHSRKFADKAGSRHPGFEREWNRRAWHAVVLSYLEITAPRPISAQ